MLPFRKPGTEYKMTTTPGQGFTESEEQAAMQKMAVVVDLMQEMIDGKLAIPKRALELLAEPYPYPEVVQVEIKTKKFHHTVAADTTCPSCQHHFKASEIVEQVNVGYRCPKCRQVIRVI